MKTFAHKIKSAMNLHKVNPDSPSSPGPDVEEKMTVLLAEGAHHMKQARDLHRGQRHGAGKRWELEDHALIHGAEIFMAA